MQIPLIWVWGSCFKKNIGILFGVILVIMSLCTHSYAKVYYTKEDALKLAFPDASKIEKKTVFLDAVQKDRIEELAKTKTESRVFNFYTGEKNEEVIGYALFGSHVVRTKPEVYMAVINPDGSLRFIEILAFYEPEEYLPAKKWFSQFKDKRLNDDLWLKRGISAISGATMTANGIIREVRKALAIFKVAILEEKDEVPDKR